MVKREIIKIDEEKCNGCGICVPNCPEGALQIIDGKARLVSDLFCDGLGACIGNCPEGAIFVEEREAEEYDERKVMENIVKQGTNTIKAHLQHLKDHGADKYLKQAKDFLEERGIENPIKEERHVHGASCPGSKIMEFSKEENEIVEEGKRSSQLKQWPIQLHLISPNAPYFIGKDLLLAADCTAFSIGNFHKDFLKGKSLVIACPKLDSNREIYVEKIKKMIDEAKINTLTVLVMEVPCCSGLLQIAKKALESATRKIPIKLIVVGIKGEIIKEEWI
ncbi:MAG: hydrogenase MvhADGHdrABC CoB-CoM heterodisulfide reductase subunit A [Candidatus Methanofastidiosum methylothiophilum]|uniref:Hydrogenase MvhADGHdrABC CoB-CoM heterodisulfide reductase subunit A n=1 Tax=Candidatus Methanofastidiosum methylothiophilum TaxID=1705564 RepID=A0A150IXN0_9EURY|nr:MAG: hydrogenase MvhADGHdrABC CoB-CoM heterodisulfide reductase subunit A [Candidatus Methanofastidiosum methylthiophilus]KYC47300.1 MAG: hydrogenase MvhADGHdrABC CoB-CoM heterodisulfide reductase subunit A [Candidatus Methanofastidiosum methylthiophilus]KYC49743.1 MAG: hydrogenase MvhADGHdrABC CoB-CoM heterodisulfide reductase subunit A [Candidatus Methanofastidiosum methylthiophilus]